MNRPNITRQLAGEYLKVFGHKEQIQFLAIRGYYLDTMGKPGENDLGIYDDCICIVAPDFFCAYNGNTDPSKRGNGIATVVAPQTVWYRRDLHGVSHIGTDAKSRAAYKKLLETGKDQPELPRTYWAFRQDSNVTVSRFGMQGTFTDSPAKRFFTDLHRGGEYTTSSEGCQTIILEQWEEFRAKGYELMDLYKQDRVPYCLMNNPQKS